MKSYKLKKLIANKGLKLKKQKFKKKQRSQRKSKNYKI